MAKKKYYKKKSYGRKGNYVGKLAKRVANLEKGHKLEFKYHDVTNEISTYTSSTMDCLTLIAQGATSGSREGLQIRLQSIYLKMEFNTNIDDTKSYIYRVILFIDTMLDGVFATTGELLEGTGLIDFVEKHENRNRFRILYDKNIVLDTNAYDSTGDEGISRTSFREYFKKFNNPHKVNYIGANASESSAGSGGLMLCCFGNTNANNGIGQVNCRLRFTE